MGEKRKRKRKEVEVEELVKAEDPPPEPERETAQGFTPDELLAAITSNPPQFLDLRDDQLAKTLLNGTERRMQEDMVGWFLVAADMQNDETSRAGPAKWRYSKDPFDCFDFYASNGCPNCGAMYELDKHHGYCLHPPALACHKCGHRACPMHFNVESESLVDRLEGFHRTDGMHPRPSFAEQLRLAEQGEEENDGIFGNENSQKEIENANLMDHNFPGGVYVRGMRKNYNFGQQTKEWWQNRFLPRNVRMGDLEATLETIQTMGRMKGPKINEICELCGNNEAYFHSYQARSADEGMTIMFECTACHHRRTMNN